MKHLKYLLILILIIVMAGCASSRKNPYAHKKRHSYINATQLGRNKYFFSREYQQKLKKNYRKRQD